MKKETIIKIIALLFFFNKIFFAQIPLNGFSKVDVIKIPNDFNKIFPIDFNSDGYKDLIIYNPTKKNYYSLASLNRNNFQAPVFHSSSFSVSSFKSQTSSITEKKIGALLNDNTQIALINFSKSGTINISAKAKLKGYAFSFDVSKNSLGKTELITAGAGLDGLEIYREDKRNISLYENIKGNTFSHLIYADLNYDSFEDIIAFDIISNSIAIFYNNHFDDYDEARTIGINNYVKDIEVIDVNSDRFTDFVINVNGKINFFIGDSVSSFQKKSVFQLENEKIELFKIFDFNADGINDIVYKTINDNQIKISFGIGNNNFTNPITLLKANNIKEFSAYVDKGGRKLAVISSNGIIYIVSKIFINENEIKLSTTNNSSDFSLFDNRNDNYKDFCWIDDSLNVLKMATSERKNLFADFFQVQLFTKCNKIFVDDKNPFVKTFFLYQTNSHNIEIIRYDFNKNNFAREIIYTKSPIEHLKIYSDRLKDRFAINVVSKKNNSRMLERYEYVNFKKLFAEEIKIDEQIIKAVVGISGGANISYLINKVNSYLLYVSYLNERKFNKSKRLEFTTNQNDDVNFHLLKIDELFSKSNPLITIITINDKSILYLLTERNNYRYSLNFPANKENNLEYVINKNSLEIFYIDRKNNLIKLLFDENFKLMKTDKMPLNKPIINYAIKKFDVQNNYLIFADKNFITFQKYD